MLTGYIVNLKMMEVILSGTHRIAAETLHSEYWGQYFMQCGLMWCDGVAMLFAACVIPCVLLSALVTLDNIWIGRASSHLPGPQSTVCPHASCLLGFCDKPCKSTERHSCICCRYISTSQLNYVAWIVSTVGCFWLPFHWFLSPFFIYHQCKSYTVWAP
jgi:hypothetical protein